MRYQILSIDVWAGEEEGLWERNDYFLRGELDLAEDMEDGEILEAIADELGLGEEFLKTSIVDEWGEYNFDIVRAEDHYPYFELRAIV